MLVEGIILSAAAGFIIGKVENSINRKKQMKVDEEKEKIYEIQRKWRNTLIDIPGKGIINSSGKTFDLYYIKITENGFVGKVKIPSGLNLDALESCVNTLQDNFNGAIQINKGKYDDYVDVIAVTSKPIYAFKIIKKPCSEWFVGYKLNGDVMFLNIDENPHLMISGITGMGKSVIKDMLVTNIIANWKNDFDIYIVQLVNNDDYMFSECKPVKKKGFDLESGLDVLKRIEKIANERADRYKENGIVSFKDWNKFNPDKKDKRIILLSDEFSFFAIDDGEADNIKKMKREAEAILKRIFKAGRAMGVNVIATLQKASSANINTTIRSQMTVLSLTQFSSQDSNMVIGTNEASRTRLERYEAIISGAGVYEKLFLPKIKELEDKSMTEQEFFNQFVPEIITPNRIKKQDKKIDKELDLLEQTRILKERAKKEYMHVCDEYAKKIEQDKNKDNIIVTNGEYDKDIIKFIENFGAITINQAKCMFYTNNINARRSLRRLVDKGVLVEYVHTKKMKEIAFTTPYIEKRLSYHEILINDFYAKLIDEGVKILEVNRYPRIFDNEISTKSKERRPDLYIRYLHNNKEYNTYLEVDYEHPTGKDKIDDYNKLWNKGKKFNIYIMKNGELDFDYNGKMEIVKLPLILKDLTILPQ